MTETTIVTESKTRQVAKHELVDVNGNLVDDEEHATGIRYTDLATGESFEHQVGGSPGAASTMLAIFGAKTLATNEASQARQKGAEGDAQVQAIKDRFALIGGGQWVDRTREGVGAKVDLDALAKAICTAMVAAGKPQPDEAEVRLKLEDKGFARQVRQVPQINQEYARLVGRQGKTLDDVMAGLAA